LFPFAGPTTTHRLELELPVVSETEPLVVKVTFDNVPLSDFVSSLKARPTSMTLSCGIRYQESKTSSTKSAFIDEVHVRACPR
jgi:hypothetical protein